MSDSFQFVGGRLCLDFINTVAWRLADEPTDRLDTHASLLRWGVSASVVAPADAALLRKASEVSQRHLLGSARELRELLYRLFRARISRRAPRPADVRRFNRWIHRLQPRRTLTWQRGRFLFKRDERSGTASADTLFEPIVRSALALLAGDQGDQVKQCHGRGCGWLFVDESRGSNRRWCSMQDCGNRAKARRYYQRRESVRRG